MKFKIKREEIEEVVDYSKLATPLISSMIRERESRYGKDLKLNKDETFSDSLALNEYRCLRQELDKREKDMIVKLDLDVEISTVFTPKKIELLNELSKGSRTTEGLAKSLVRNPKSISRDLAILEKFGIIGRTKTGGKTKVYLKCKEFEITTPQKFFVITRGLSEG